MTTPPVAFLRARLEILIQQQDLDAALAAEDPRAPLGTFEQQCWLEAALGRLLKRGRFSIQTAVLEDPPR